MLNHLPRTRALIGRTNRFSGSAFDYNLCHALISESRCLRIKKVTIIEFPVYVYLHVYHFDYRKRFAWIKPYDDVIYHVLNMMWNHAVWVLVNYKTGYALHNFSMLSVQWFCKRIKKISFHQPWVFRDRVY